MAEYSNYKMITGNLMEASGGMEDIIQLRRISQKTSIILIIEAYVR